MTRGHGPCVLNVTELDLMVQVTGVVPIEMVPDIMRALGCVESLRLV